MGELAHGLARPCSPPERREAQRRSSGLRGRRGARRRRQGEAPAWEEHREKSGEGVRLRAGRVLIRTRKPAPQNYCSRRTQFSCKLFAGHFANPLDKGETRENPQASRTHRQGRPPHAATALSSSTFFAESTCSNSQSPGARALPQAKLRPSACRLKRTWHNLCHFE